MPTIRNTYGPNHLRVAGVVLPPCGKARIADANWQSWLENGGSSIAARFLEVVPDEATDAQLSDRDEGIEPEPEPAPRRRRRAHAG